MISITLLSLSSFLPYFQVLFSQVAQVAWLFTDAFDLILGEYTVDSEYQWLTHLVITELSWSHLSLFWSSRSPFIILIHIYSIASHRSINRPSRQNKILSTSNSLHQQNIKAVTRVPPHQSHVSQSYKLLWPDKYIYIFSQRGSVPHQLFCIGTHVHNSFTTSRTSPHKWSPRFLHARATVGSFYTGYFESKK